MNLFQILSCSPSMETLIRAVKFVLNVIRWLIPIVLIVLGSIDMFKAMASSDDKKAGEARKTFTRRLIYAVVAFLIPFIVTFAFDIVGQIIKDNNEINEVNNHHDEGFFECWYGVESSTSNRVNDNLVDVDFTKEYCFGIENNDLVVISDKKCTGNSKNQCYGILDDCYEKLVEGN